jgi:hypothetical protein
MVMYMATGTGSVVIRKTGVCLVPCMLTVADSNHGKICRLAFHIAACIWKADWYHAFLMLVTRTYPFTLCTPAPAHGKIGIRICQVEPFNHVEEDAISFIVWS